jgi:hypothetical protein
MTSTSITLEKEQQRKRIKNFFYDESVLPGKLHPQIYYFLHLEKMMATLRQSVLDRVAGYKSQHSGGVSITQRFYVVVIEQICLLFIWLCQTKYKRRCM